MKKIEVPQELQEKIIYLYVEKQYGLERIKKELHLPFGQTVIKRVLSENGIRIRTYLEAKSGVPKIAVPQELQQQIIDAYNKGYGLNKIVKELQLIFSFDKVKSILEENGVKIRNLQESARVKIMPDLRKYPVNDDYELESHNGSWLMGFIAANGYLPITKGAKSRIIISVQRKDEEILHSIARELGYNGQIYQYVSSNGYLESSLSFSSKKIREKLENYGIVNNKTFKLKRVPNLPKEYRMDFIRGFIDGDGSIYNDRSKGKNHINISITCASKEFLEDIIKIIYEECGIGLNKTIYKDHNNYSVRYYVKESLILCDKMYNNNYLALPRKKGKYFSIILK